MADAVRIGQKIRIQGLDVAPDGGKVVHGLELVFACRAAVEHGQLDGVLVAHGPGRKIDDVPLPEDPFQFGHVVPYLASTITVLSRRRRFR